jgi:hypothetical protein
MSPPPRPTKPAPVVPKKDQQLKIQVTKDDAVKAFASAHLQNETDPAIKAYESALSKAAIAKFKTKGWDATKVTVDVIKTVSNTPSKPSTFTVKFDITLKVVKEVPVDDIKKACKSA